MALLSLQGKGKCRATVDGTCGPDAAAVTFDGPHDAHQADTGAGELEPWSR